MKKIIYAVFKTYIHTPTRNSNNNKKEPREYLIIKIAMATTNKMNNRKIKQI